MTSHTNDTSCTKPFANQSVMPPMTVSHAQPAAALNGAVTASTIGSHGHIGIGMRDHSPTPSTTGVQPATRSNSSQPDCNASSFAAGVGPASAVAVGDQPTTVDVLRGRRGPCATPAAASRRPAHRGSTPSTRRPTPSSAVASTTRRRRSAPRPRAAARPARRASSPDRTPPARTPRAVPRRSRRSTSRRKISRRPTGECAIRSSVDAT